MLTQPMAQRIEHWPLEKLIPYARNPRTHSDAQVAQIAASIAAFGFNNPILVDTKAGIIAGHGRLLAARKLQLKRSAGHHFGSPQRRPKACIHTRRQSTRAQRRLGRRTLRARVGRSSGRRFQSEFDRLRRPGARPCRVFFVVMVEREHEQRCDDLRHARATEEMERGLSQPSG